MENQRTREASSKRGLVQNTWGDGLGQAENTNPVPLFIHPFI